MGKAIALSTEALVKEYETGDDDLVLLDGLSVTIDRGSFAALRGPSGSGKTTLLNIFAGLDTPTGGSVVVLGAPIGAMSERVRTRFRADHIGIVFQDFQLMPGLSAIENAMLGRLPWEGERELEKRAADLLGRLRLGERLAHPPSHLSACERQKVGVARALLGNPEILLANEPTGNLDAASTEEIIHLLAEIRAERGLTIVVATHDVRVASAADHRIFLSKGRIRARVTA